MGRILVVVLGLVCILGGAWWYLSRHAVTQPSVPLDVDKAGPDQPSEAKARLDNVHHAADRIEGQMKQRADDAAKDPYAQ